MVQSSNYSAAARTLGIASDDLGIDVAVKLRRIVVEESDKFGRLLVAGVRIDPGAARTQRLSNDPGPVA